MELIYQHNPWWRGREDIVIKKWKNMRIKWYPSWLTQISLSSFSLNFILGPRQTGKTTGIKLLIHDLIKKEQPERIFYFNCDFLPDFEGLKRILDAYLEFRKGYDIKSSFIFLDEITSVAEWWRVIKGYIDLGIFENDVLTITGSSSLKLKGETELFPGRRGKGKNITVMPLSFREFLEVNGIKLRLRGDLEKDMVIAQREERVGDLFSSYLKTGGFPLSINKDPTAQEQFISAFESEVLRAKKEMLLMKGLLASIFRKTPSPFSFSTLGNDVGVSYKTAESYIDVLKNLFIVDIAFFKEKKINWRKEKKIFFLDPFIAQVLSLWVGEEFLEGSLYEWIVQSHLARRFGQVFYYRNSYEIDCIANDLRIEVKVGKPYRKYPRGVKILDKEALPYFLAVI